MNTRIIVVITVIFFYCSHPLLLSQTITAVYTGADLGLLAGRSQSVVVICNSTCELGGGGWRHMCRSTYIMVNIIRLLILQSLR